MNSFTMSHRRVREILPELKRLNSIKGDARRKYLKTCNGKIIDCLSECIKNLLKGRLSLKAKAVKALRRYRRFLRKVALKKTPQNARRRIIQKGGFLGALLPALISGLSGLVARNG